MVAWSRTQEVLNEEVSIQDYTQQTDKESVHHICVCILKAGHGHRSRCRLWRYDCLADAQRGPCIEGSVVATPQTLAKLR